MAKISFPLPTDDQMHRFCFACQKEGAIQVHENNKTFYHCNACNVSSDRAYFFMDHQVWLDDDSEIWHDSSGVFVRNAEGKFLFYMRTEWPFLLTSPGGHTDKGETPEFAAKRELKEETGIDASELIKILDEDIIGDSCSGGADRHRWHAYLVKVPNDQKVIISDDEGENPVWLTLEEARLRGVVMPIEWIIKRYSGQLQA